MNSNTFKNADIDRKNEETNTEELFADDEPTLDCARCGRRGLGEEQVCIREWEGDSDAPMCAPCWDTTEQEEDEAFAVENIAELLGETPIVYEDPDKVSAEIVEEEGHPADNTPHNYCGECDCCVACGCCECVEEEEEREVFGKCDECGMEGKFFGKEGDDWTCSACLYGGGDSDDTDDDDEEWAYDCVVCKKHLYITELAKCEERDLCAYCCVGENRRGCPCYVCVANN